MLAKCLAACTRLSITVSQLFEPQLQKIAIFTYFGLHFLFAIGTPLWQSRKTLHEWKDNSVLAKPVTACFPVIRTTIAKNRHFYVPRPSFFVCHGDAPVAITQNVAWMKRHSVLAKPVTACTFNSFPVIRTASTKKSPFSRTAAHIFVSHGDAPAIITQYLHGWKDNSMLAKPLAACTCLSSIVSELYDA